jgi:hypothetical protein
MWAGAIGAGIAFHRDRIPILIRCSWLAGFLALIDGFPLAVGDALGGELEALDWEIVDLADGATGLVVENLLDDLVLYAIVV